MEPLQGVRIIEVTTNAAGPMATGMLADQGADVIRIEPVGAGDPSRHVGGNRGGVSAYNAYMNRNKRSMALDLKDPELRERWRMTPNCCSRMSRQATLIPVRRIRCLTR